MKRNNNFDITSTYEGNPSIEGLPFLELKREVLGDEYELSLVFVDTEKSRELNNTYRGKDKPTNVLSFSMDENSGEIFICPAVADEEHEEFGLSREGFLAYLFIHALLHLKGYDHGSTMKKQEENLAHKFNIK